MPAKQNDNPLPKYMSKIREGGKKGDKVIGYKYQRRVPKRVWQMAGLAGDKDYPRIHDIYLSADLTEAVHMAQKWRDTHDQQFAKLLTPEGGLSHLTTGLVKTTVKRAKDKSIPDERRDHGDSWRDWKLLLEHFGTDAQRLDDTKKADYLASCLASAFGLRDMIQEIQSPYARALAERESREQIPPASAGDLVEFNAAKAMLLDQYRNLKPNRPAPDGERLSQRVDQYADFAAIKDTTRTAMRGKVNRFIKHLGRDPALDTVDTATIKTYRDALDADPKMNRTSVNAYLTPLRTLYKWAVNEGYSKSDPTLQVQTLKDKRTIEDRQWKPFNDTEIKSVWHVVQDGWGPGGHSRFSEPRKATFLMVFRVLLWTGMRPAEVFKLTADDVFENRIEAKDTKTGPRTVAIASAISDFPAFIQSQGWLDAFKNEKHGNGTVTGLQSAMSESFSSMIRKAGLTNQKHVLYSTKSTLVRKLNWLEAPDNVQRSIIGHKTPGKLRHYTTLADLRKQKQYLDQVTYCEGLE